MTQFEVRVKAGAHITAPCPLRAESDDGWRRHLPVPPPSDGRQYSLSPYPSIIHGLTSNMFSKSWKSDLAVIPLVLDKEGAEETSRRRRKRILVHSAWKSRPIEGEFHTLFSRLMDYKQVLRIFSNATKYLPSPSQ